MKTCARAHSPARAWLISAPVLILLVPLVAYSFTVPNPQPGSSALLLLVLITMAAGGRLLFLILRGEPRLLSMSVWIFIYVFMGIAPVVQLRAGINPGTTPGLPDKYQAPAALAVAVSIAPLMLGESLGIRHTEAQHGRGRIRNSTVSGVATVCMAIAALILAAYYVYRIGPASLALDRTSLGIIKARLWQEPGQLTLIVGISSFPVLVSFLALRRLNLQRRSMGERPLWTLTFLTGAAALIVTNPVSSPRYYAGTVILAVLAGLGVFSTASRFRMSTVAVLFGLVFLFPAAGVFRYGQTDFAFDPSTALLSGDFDAFAQIQNTMNYLEVHGITWGRQALGVLLFWVPRSMWTEKPIDTGVFLAEYRDYSYTNLSAPMWAELLINGGWVLLVVGFLAVGYFVGRFDTRGLVAMQTSARLPVINYILPFYAFILMRGSLLQAALILAIIVLSARFVSTTAPAKRPNVRATAPKPGERAMGVVNE